MTKWDDLLAVQEHDTAADQLAHRKRTLPERAELDQLMAALAALEAEVTQVEAGRHELGRAQQKLEDEISTVSEKAAQHEKHLYSGSVTNPRELQAMQDEIGSLQKRISHLEDQELELMEQIEPLDADLARHAARRTELDASGADLRSRIAEAEVEIDRELAAVTDARAAAASGIDAALLAQYDDLRPKGGGIAIARLVAGHCQGCHLALSAVEVDRLRKLPPEEPATCEECGRLLAR